MKSISSRLLFKWLICLIVLTIPCLGSANGYVGARLGVMQVGFDDNEVDSDPSSLGLLAGYRFDSILRGLSAELEITRGIRSGEVSGNDLEVESQGLYIAYRTQGRVYVKGRLGWMDASLDAGSLSEDEGGETFGAAVGVLLQPLAVELDVTAIDDDVTFISLGLLWSWQ